MTTDEGPRAAPAPRTVRQSGRATTDVSALLSFCVALPLYCVLVFGARAMPPYYRALLLERGWVTHAIMMLASLAAAILVLKAIGLRAQRRALSLDVLPDDLPVIARDDVPRALEHLEALRAGGGGRRRPKSLLLERVERILEHFRARGDVAETADVASADADADAAAIAASFTTVKVLVWAIPIFGFIGTVIGIGDAVAGFSQSLEGADRLDSIKSSLGDVTAGLAVAFDTTLVALVASVLVMLPASWLQKAEEQLVVDVDDCCATQLLRRLVTPSALAPGETTNAAELRQSLVAALAAPLGELLAANARLMSGLAQDREASSGVQASLKEDLATFATAARELGPGVVRAVAQLERATTLAEQASGAMGRTQDQLARELGASRQLLQLLAAGLAASSAEPRPPAAEKHTNGANGSASRGE